MEKTIYTRSWADGVAKDFSRDLFRSALFASILLVGFLGVFFLMSSSEDLSNYDQSPISTPGIISLAFLSFIVLVVCCYIALFFVADDRRWGVQEPLVPHIWEDREERWITSTVSFAHYLEERGSHIEAALVQYDDPRVAAHRMIDKVDERTLQLYLSLLSAMQMERERARVEWIEAKPKTLDSKTRQA
jgi:hypothetical protein